MSLTLSAKDICERALRAIGAFPITESAPDGEHMREALSWLDLIMAEIAGTSRILHLLPETVTLTLTPGESRYEIKSALGTDFPPDGVQFPVGASLMIGNARRPIPIVTRDLWATLASQQGATGVPQALYVSRYPDAVLFTYPTLPADTPVPVVIHLDVQRYAPKVAPSGVTGDAPQGSAFHGFRQAWQRYLIHRLAADLGRGPIVKLGQGSLNEFKAEYIVARKALDAFENREHDTEPPIVRPYDPCMPSFRIGAGPGK